MLHVSNKTCIRDLAKKSYKSSKTRNQIAVIAIILTTLLFTSLFTVLMSMNAAVQDFNLKQSGTKAMGKINDLTEEQCAELKKDKNIEKYGLHRRLGIAKNEEFLKNRVEVGYADKNAAEWMFLNLKEGRLPEEGTNEVATDLEILKLLGIKPEIGKEFSLLLEVNGEKIEKTVTLCGWWEKDSIINVNHVLLSDSQISEILNQNNTKPVYTMDIMFKLPVNIDEKLNTLLSEHSYQNEDRNKDNYINAGINSVYSQTENVFEDPTLLISVIVLLLLIVFSGYLIIYNIFRISVVSDIHFYGLLKTIGTTGKQIKKIIHRQALSMCIRGVPIGLFLGWLFGKAITPAVFAGMNGINMSEISIHPIIFIASVLFTLFTVYISCIRPGKIASKISPIEAIRYTEKRSKTKKKKSARHFSLLGMAFENLKRNKGRTFITITSLALAVVILQVTVIFTNSLDKETFLNKNCVSDFILSDARYFQYEWNEDTFIPPDIIEEVRNAGKIKKDGVVYGQTVSVQQYITEEWYKKRMGTFLDDDKIKQELEHIERNQDNLIVDNVMTYGMEPYILDKLNVVEGDLTPLYEEGNRAIAAVYQDDDNGNPIKESHYAKVGDKIKLHYVTEWEYYNPDTGEIYQNYEDIGNQNYDMRPLSFKDVEYEVTALVTVPYALSYRFFGNDQFVMNDETFKQVTGTDKVMIYSCDVENKSRAKMESFIKEYTTKVKPGYDYESKAKWENEFKKVSSLFMTLGSSLSFIIGLIGILNFFNAILTGMITRKKEFAMLQAVGMTGKQLKMMLIHEGLIYAIGSVIMAFILTILIGLSANQLFANFIWFFKYKPTFLPIMSISPIFILLGILLPIYIYRMISKETIVERLRETAL